MELPNILTIAIVFAMGCVGATANAQCVVPNTISNGQTADASKVMGNFNALNNCINTAPAGSANAVQVNGGAGTFAGVGPLANGQLIIGSTGAPPQAATLTAGSGVTITNSPGSITIAASGGGGGGGSSFTPPVLANFTHANNPTGGTATSVTGGVQLYAPALGGGFNLNTLLQAAPTPPYTMWMRPSFAGSPNTQFSNFGFAFADGSGKLAVYDYFAGGASGAGNLEYETYSSYTLRNSTVGIVTTFVPPAFMGVYDDGTNLNFLMSYDGVTSFTVYSVSRTVYLSAGPTQLGFFANGYSQPITIAVAHWASSLPGAGSGSGGACSTVTTTAAQASVTLTPPSGFTNLQISGFGAVTGTGSGIVNINMQFNGDTAADYWYNQTQFNGGSGDAAGGAGQSNVFVGEFSGSGAPSTGSVFKTDIPGYSNASFDKAMTSNYSLYVSGTTISGQRTGGWLNATAITSILIYPASGTFAAGDTITMCPS